ncbi:hypothetical protein ACG33_12455 [Steroidobacter denitrificans]|uniref:NADH:flavin oxidoreductase n=1 Tax=Steroidobacter denitrificans TaxID=465721 RepID=A0A127FBY5_STEDE|nr:FAD-dependent oxidoreductase [Steroidobacter denitrificans]AMN47893.1 hypothetical protein ACG33_12455 [Steroidobacter denitrificans]
MSDMKFTHLFTPLQIGPMRVPNRICETTNTINSSMTPGMIDEHFIAHHVAKARGGTGWIGSETWLLDVPFPPETADEVGLSIGCASHGAAYQYPAFAEGMKKFVTAVHEAGSVAVVQLTQLTSAWGPSAVPMIGAQSYTPHVLGEEEIEYCIDVYAAAARVAQSVGADGIEIHCAHETMGHAFLSPVSNRRTDRWGGGPSERIRFVVEVLKRVRGRIGESLALGMRISAQEFRQGGYDHMEMREMLYGIAQHGLLDFVDIDTGHCWGAPSYVPNSYYPHAQYREAGKAAKADLSGLPRKVAVMFTGRINDPVLAENLIEEGYCDLVGMVRAGIADPEFANKAREGRLGEIRRCIACTRCIDEASESLYVPYTPMCSINPVIGSELRWEQQYRPAQKPKRVVVVGGGLAGCEAARIAAQRGHRVTLLEQGKRLGGQLLIAAKAPGRDSFEDQIYFEENEMTRLGVEVRLQNRADAASIKALSPEAIVIATGARPRVPHDVSGLELAHVAYGWDVMQGAAACGQRVALVSQEDYYETVSVADYLASQGREVVVFHKSAQLGREIARYSQGMALARMEELGVQTVGNVILTQIDAGGLQFVSVFGGRPVRHEGFDSVVLVYGAVAQNELYDQFKAEGFTPLYLAGAAWLPRRMAEATRHGANIGLVI